jgi:sucrose-phosphate synthase
VIYSHGEFLDILPWRASKGHALHHVAKRFGIPLEQTIAAGDSGNDLEMLRMAAHAIIVSNNSGELERLRGTRHAFFANRPYAGGILEGIARYSKKL